MYQKMLFNISGPTSGGGESFNEELKLDLLPLETAGFIKCPRCDSSVLIRRDKNDDNVYTGTCDSCKAVFINT